MQGFLTGEVSSGNLSSSAQIVRLAIVLRELALRYVACSRTDVFHVVECVSGTNVNLPEESGGSLECEKRARQGTRGFRLLVLTLHFLDELGLEASVSRQGLICTRLHATVPEFYDSMETNTRFFTSPLITAFVNPLGFGQTVDRFNLITDVEDEPGVTPCFAHRGVLSSSLFPSPEKRAPLHSESKTAVTSSPPGYQTPHWSLALLH